MPKYRFLAIFLICTLSRAAETGKPFISLYQSMVTGGHFQNWALIQDGRGVMYIGNGYGVQEFDGSTWRLILNSNSSFAKSFARDSSGRIYVGSAAELGYLAPDAKGAMQYISLLEYIPLEERTFNYVWYTHATREGIYFMTREKLFRFQKQPQEPGQDESWQVRIWRPDGSVGYFGSCFYIDQTLYVAHRSVGLLKMSGDSLVLIPGGQLLSKDRINVMLPFPGRPGALLLGTDVRGLFLYDGLTFKPFNTEADGLLSEGSLNDGALLPDSSFALASSSSGLLIINRAGKLLQHYTKESGLLTNTLSAVYVDRQKNIWLAMDNGIAILENGSALARFPFSSGNSPTFFVRHLGRLYASTNNGLYALDAHDSEFKPLPGAALNQYSDFLAINQRLFTEAVHGIFEITGLQMRNILPTSASASSVVCLHRALIDSNLILAGSTGGVYTIRYYFDRRDPMEWISAIPGLTVYVCQITEPQPGTFWLGTYDAGALRLRFANNDPSRPIVERFGPEQGLPGGTTFLYQLGGRLVATSGKGLFCWDETSSRFKPDPFFKDLTLGVNPAETVAATDAADNIWIYAGKETVVYRKLLDGQYKLERGQFSRFSDENVLAIYPEKDGTVWFGATSGAIHYTPGEEKTPPVSYTALIRSVRFGDDSTLYEGGFEPVQQRPDEHMLTYRFNAMTFEFSAPSFIKPEANEFQIMLEGFDKNWLPWSRDSKHNYTNLPQGRYTFRVKARNVYGQESREASFAFFIRPPWYSTWWAYLSYALLAATFIFAVVAARTRKLQERSKALEKLVQERTAKIEEQKNNVEQLSHIGKHITASLSIENIIHTVYEHVNTMMDASVFGIGLYDPQTERLDFPATIVNKQVLTAHSLPVSDENHLAIWCCKNVKDVIINDYEKEYSLYIRKPQSPVAGKNPESILYMPLVSNDKVIGVITAQSFNKNAYTDYHLNMLRNLATYSAIALDNADAYHKLSALVEDLKATQEKLVTQSKLAALGGLTAGIAHEIKNPLNFVNNFAELINDLVDELREQLATKRDKYEKDELAEIEVTLTTLQQNAVKVIEHGKRADSIVRSMLQHSRGKAGERQLTDLNAMLGEDINLAYHGMRAQDSRFNVKIETDLDPAVGKLNIIPQDVSRVFLNIISNGFYEVHRKKMEQDGNFSPTLTVTSRNLGNQIEVRIRDNGKGIPATVREKLFTPFFTTKPTGKGTGLGLSISYDIIVHQHSGQLTFETQEGEFTEFIIRLPY